MWRFSILISIMSILSTHGSICHDFFTVISELEPWRTDGNEVCEDTLYRMDYQIRLISAQMVEMNTTLHLYTSYRARDTCVIKYPNIKVHHFNATQLMVDYGLEDVVRSFAQYVFGSSDYARISDICRVLLAHKYQHTYIDMDIHFLSNNKSIFQNPFIAVHIWNVVKCSAEITNAAFCLDRPALNDLKDYISFRILHGSDKYLYTELGPLLFTKVLMNKYPYILYSLNHPEEYDVSAIVKEIRDYNHTLLHLTSSIRELLARSKTISFEELNIRIRSKLGLSKLKLPKSRITELDALRASRAMHFNHPSRVEIGLNYVVSLVDTFRDGMTRHEQMSGSGGDQKVRIEDLANTSMAKYYNMQLLQHQRGGLVPGKVYPLTGEVMVEENRVDYSNVHELYMDLKYMINSLKIRLELFLTGDERVNFTNQLQIVSDKIDELTSKTFLRQISEVTKLFTARCGKSNNCFDSLFAKTRFAEKKQAKAGDFDSNGGKKKRHDEGAVPHSQGGGHGQRPGSTRAKGKESKREVKKAKKSGSVDKQKRRSRSAKMRKSAISEL